MISRALFAKFKRSCTVPDVDDNLLGVHGDARHPLGLLVTDVLVDELEDETQEAVEVLRSDHGDVAAGRGWVGIVWALVPPRRKVGAHERQQDVNDMRELWKRSHHQLSSFQKKIKKIQMIYRKFKPHLLFTGVILGLPDKLVHFLQLRLQVRHALLQPGDDLLRLERLLRESRSHHGVRVELVERGLEEGHREGGGHGGEARADAGAVGVDLHPEELLGPRKAETGAQRVEALDDLVAGDLDLVDEEVASEVVGGEVVEGRDEDGDLGTEFSGIPSAKFQQICILLKE